MSSSLGDAFPDKFREDFSERKISPGSVLRVHDNNTTPPKTKRIVILAVSADKVWVGYLFINSEINPNKFPTERLKKLHLLLKADTCNFLDWDSYLDCSSIKERDLTELKNIISKDPSQHMGNLNYEDIEKARDIIKDAPTIPKRDKKKYSLL